MYQYMLAYGMQAYDMLDTGSWIFVVIFLCAQLQML